MNKHALKHTRTRDHILTEISELRRRLWNAEESLRAIGRSEIDAIVVSGPEGYNIFTLPWADYPYRELVESLSEGAVTMSTDGTIFYCNRGFAAMVKMSAAEIVNCPFLDFVMPSDARDFETLFRKRGETGIKGDITLRRSGGSPISVNISLKPLRVGDFNCVTCIVTDIGERKRAEEGLHNMTEELEQRVRDRTAELEAKNRELADMNRLFIGRELRMAELKEKIAELEKRRPDQGSGSDLSE